MAEEFMIPIWNSKSEILGYKKLEDINEKVDTLHIINIILVNKWNNIFITKNNESMWASEWSSSITSMVTKDETAVEAARRALNQELGVYRYDLMLVKKDYKDFNGIKRVISNFHVKTNDIPRISNKKIEGRFIDLDELKTLISEEMLDPLFLNCFENIKSLLA